MAARARPRQRTPGEPRRCTLSVPARGHDVAQRGCGAETLRGRGAGGRRAPRPGAGTMNVRGMSNARLLLALVGVAIMLTIAGAVSFVRYSSRAAPDSHRVAVAPFDLFVSGSTLARAARATRDGSYRRQPGWTAVPQEVVAQRWKGQDRAEAAAVELARRTQAGIAIYGACGQRKRRFGSAARATRGRDVHGGEEDRGIADAAPGHGTGGG